MAKPHIRILLVEDDEDDYVLARNYLSESKLEDYVLVWARTAEEALEQLYGVDVILADYELGGRSGIDLVREAKSRGIKAPIILLTGFGSYELDLEAMQVGAAEFLTKNELNASTIERSIRYAIEHKRNEEALREAQEELEMRVQERTQELRQANAELRDEIGERKRAQAQLAYQAYLIENVSDAIIATDAEGVLTSWNQAAEKIYGWKAEEVLQKPAQQFFLSNFFDFRTEGLMRELLDYGQAKGEAVQLDKEGRQIVVDYTSAALRDENGKVIGYVSVNRDITDRKRMEAELAEVHRRLMDGREAERLHLSQELHDGPIQNLYGLTYKTAELNEAFVDNGNQKKLVDLKEGILQVVSVLRTICGDLRPPTLSPFGLEQTIRSHANQFREDNPGVVVKLDLHRDQQSLPERVRLALFRIYQQAMANIVRHAQATRVDIIFNLDDEQIYLEVRDNGKGFDVPSRWIDYVRKGHLGLAGIAERAEVIGGTLEIISAPGKGTAVIVRVPRQT